MQVRFFATEQDCSVCAIRTMFLMKTFFGDAHPRVIHIVISLSDV